MVVEGPLTIRINDKWVNIEAWKKVHPGGSLTLERFRSNDATDAFFSLHSKEAIQKFTRMKSTDPPKSQSVITPSAATLAFRKFKQQLEEEGWFNRNWAWDFFYVSLITFMAIFGTLISYEYPIIASILIGLSMQQAGWMGHDYVHGRGRVSCLLGRLIGGGFNGFSSTWWSNKHNTHHIHTNQMGVDEDIANDPILHLWIPAKDKEFFLRPYQHFYYHLVYSFLYVSWRIQSLQWSFTKGYWSEIFIISMNYIWLMYLPLFVSFFSILIGGWLVAEIVTATHQSEDILDGQSFSFIEDQLRTTRDVELGNFFLNWLWGGMQFQVIHHLFPTMPKYRYSSMVPKVREFTKANGLEYRSSSTLEILKMNYDTMKKFAQRKMIVS